MLLQTVLVFGSVAMAAVAKSLQPQQHELSHLCSTTAPLSGNYFDLAPLARVGPNDVADWHVKSSDGNFSINFCSPLIEMAPEAGTVSDVAAVANISAVFIDKDNNQHSIGQFVNGPYVHGRHLLMQYKDGSPCPSSPSLKRSSLFMFKCDVSLSRASISHVSSLDNCTYIFEVKTPYACPSTNEEVAMSPVTIFFIISLVAAVVFMATTTMMRRSLIPITRMLGILNSFSTSNKVSVANYRRFGKESDSMA